MHHSIGSLATYLTEDLSLRHSARESAQMSAWILEHIAGFSRIDIVLNANQPAEEAHVEAVQDVLRRLRAGEPLQYVFGAAPFLDFELAVDSRVLIPRPETEELVVWATELLSGKSPHVLDVGTGSGCIALGIKHRYPGAQVWACDISEDALEVARENASRLQLDVQFSTVNILEQQPPVPPLQLLISNPPYIGIDETSSLENHVVAHEPREALFAGEDPLLFYQALAVQGEELLAPDGVILVELHSQYAHDTQELFVRSGYQTELRKDLQGMWRMLKAWR